MAAKPPAPSKAALHALRGIVFTTSCTVAVLAEERRQRTKLARTAIDNARRLHTVKARRNSVSLPEGILSDDDLHLLALHGAIDVPRPRRSRPKRQNEAAPAGENNAITTGNALRPGHPERVSSSRPFAHLSPATSPPMTVASTSNRTLNSTSNTYDVPQSSHNSSMTIPEIHRSAFAIRQRNREIANATVQADRQARQARQEELFRMVRPLLSLLTSSGQGIDSLHLDAIKYITSPPRVNSNGDVHLADALPLLGRLLTDMEAASTNKSRFIEDREIALGVLDKVISLNPAARGSTTTRRLRHYALRLVKATVSFDDTDLAPIVDIMAPLYNGLSQLLLPLFSWLAEQSNVSGVRRVVEAVSSRESIRSSEGDWLADVIALHAERHKSSKDAKGLYEFINGNSPPVDSQTMTLREYEFHSVLLRLAWNDGSSRDSYAEIQKLQSIDSDKAQSDGQLQRILLHVDLTSGRCTSPHEAIARTERIERPNDHEPRDFSVKMADYFAAHLPPKDLEYALRLLTNEFGLKLEKATWVQSVLGHHSKHVDKDAMLSWVEFCVQNGFKMDNGFLQSFYIKYRQHWKATDRELVELNDRVWHACNKSSKPWIAATKVATQLLTSKHEPLSRSQEDWETMYIRSASHINASSISDDALFHRMQSNAQIGKWESAWASFDEYHTSGRPYSLRCLRLAVLAKVKLDDGKTENARRLLSDALAQGHSVSPVLTPVLMAELSEGQRPIEVIQATLSQGCKVHDMVYNRAARLASSEGDQRGAINICKIAAQENGDGNLLYNEYNFANLLFAYTGLGSYRSLTSLLAEFTAEKRWWAGNELCKQGIKLAMKSVAKRAAVASTRRDALFHEAVLPDLDRALHFGFECKQFHDDRMTLAEGFLEATRGSVPSNGTASAQDSGANAAPGRPEGLTSRATVSNITLKSKDTDAGRRFHPVKANPVKVSVPAMAQRAESA